MSSAPVWADEPRVFSGPFEMRQALTFHVVNESGGEFKIHLHWREASRAQMERPLLVRVFDPEEHVITRLDAPGEKGPIEESREIIVPARGKGVYEVAITGFLPVIDFATEPKLPFGVFGYPVLACHDDQFADAWAFLPPRLEQMTVRCGEAMQSLTLSDERGSVMLNLAGASAGQVNLPKEGEHIWRLSAKCGAVGPGVAGTGGAGTLNFAGTPIVLCPDEASARAIHASVDVLDDGTICFHKFQIRAHDLLKRYRAMPASAFVVRPPTLVRYKEAWLREPARNQLLLGPYGVYAALDVVLSEQNLDAGSPWFGCIHTWRDDAGRLRGENPWATYTRLGLSRVAATATALAAVYSIREPLNPLGGDEALRNRIIIASLQELMLLREHELPLPEFTEYQGGDRAFTFSNFTFSFPLAVRECPADVRAVWTEGLQRCVDHEALSEVPVIVNQWSFLIRGIQQFSEGVDDPWYGQVVKRHVRWILTRNDGYWGFMPAGYFAESGPDATYAGIDLHNLGWVYRRTRDGDLKEGLRRCLDLFNHTVAPEPDGSWMGATSFCHRTPDDWSQPQFGAGIEMLADDLAEAAPLLGRAWMSRGALVGVAALRQAEQDATRMLAYLNRQAFRDPGEGVLRGAPELAFLVWQCFAAHPLQGQLPVRASQSFTRAFGDEFMCVRRPRYYGFLYAGGPMAQWQKQSRKTDPHKQYPRNGGGLCMFWTPGFGTSLLAKNWSAYAAQTIIAERGDGADWEDYWSVQRQFDAAKASATITSTLLNQPIHVERRVQFLDQGVRYDVSLTIDAPPHASAVWECFPYPLDKPKPLQLTLLDAQGNRVEPDQAASAICFSVGGPEVHLIVFEHPRRCRIGSEQTVDDYNHPRKHGYVLAAIPEALQAGRTGVKWLMVSAAAVDVPRSIASAVAGLRGS